MTRYCDACDRQVGDAHVRNGVPRCRSGNHFWTAARRWKLMELTDAGWDDDRIAATLTAAWGRPISVRALKLVRWRHRVGGIRSSALSADQVATMLGVSHGDTVRRWVVNGWLPARRGRPMGRGFSWLIDRVDLWSFVEDPLHWHSWSPDRVTDAALRRHVSTVRGADQFVPVREAVGRLADRGLFVSRATVDYWVRTGHLSSVTLPLVDAPMSKRCRRGLRLIPVVALDDIEPPAMGGGQRKVAAA